MTISAEQSFVIADIAAIIHSGSCSVGNSQLVLGIEGINACSLKLLVNNMVDQYSMHCVPNLTR